MAATALEVTQVRRRLDPAALPFETTAEVPPLHGTIGQHRALDAIDFGLEVGTPGYNLFLAGAAGSGRESTILDCLQRAAAGPGARRPRLRAQLRRTGATARVAAAGRPGPRKRRAGSSSSTACPASRPRP